MDASDFQMGRASFSFVSMKKSEILWHRGEGGRMTTKRDATGWNDCLLATLPAWV
jgi:hypothetical protein